MITIIIVLMCNRPCAQLRHMEEHPCAGGVPALVCVTWAEAESFPLLSPPDSSRSPWGASFSRSHGESGLPFLFPTLKGIRSEGETGLISWDVSSDSTTVSKFSFPQEFCLLPVGPWRDPWVGGREELQNLRGECSETRAPKAKQLKFTAEITLNGISQPRSSSHAHVCPQQAGAGYGGSGLWGSVFRERTKVDGHDNALRGLM